MVSEIELVYKNSPISIEALSAAWRLSNKDRDLFMHGAFMMCISPNFALINELSFLTCMAGKAYQEELMIPVQGGSL